MPHIIVEYSENLSRVNIPVLLSDLHQSLADQETVDIAAIKTRAHAIPEGFLVIGAADDLNEFLHITLKLLPGRDVSLKKRMAEALHNVACGAVHTEYSNCCITVEVMELDGETYIK